MMMKNMMMKNMTKGALSMALLGAIFAIGCSSSSGGADGGDASGTGGTGGAAPYGLTPGDTCFDIISVQMGSTDDCGIGVADTFDPVAMTGLVGAALLVHYDMPTATVTIGKSGSLGAGQVTFNHGTLTRDNNPMLAGKPACTWHQKDTSNITVTNTNEFDLAATETQDMFSSGCAAGDKPNAAGMCTSTWTWHMKKGTKMPPNCD